MSKQNKTGDPRVAGYSGLGSLQTASEQRAPGPDPDEVEFNRRLRSPRLKIQRKVRSDDLTMLERAGVPRESMLQLLALTVDMTATGTWAELMRNKKDELLSIAGRLETLQPDVDRALRDPSMRLPLWVYIMGRGMALGMKEPKAFTFNDSFIGIFTLPITIRFVARTFRDEAKKFGRFLRRYGRAGSQAGIGLLLMRVYLFRLLKQGAGHNLTPQRGPDHLNVLAFLLTDAFEAVGLNKSFSADGLRQVWKRAGRRMLAIWYKNLSQTQEQAPQPAYPSAVSVGESNLHPLSAASDTSSR